MKTTTTKKTKAPKPTTKKIIKKSRTRKITSSDMWTWIHALEKAGFKPEELAKRRGKGRIHPTLLTLSPACAGVATGLWWLLGWKAAEQTRAIRLIERNLAGTYNYFDVDVRRADAAVDWAVKLALPKFLSLLPSDHPARSVEPTPAALIWAFQHCKAITGLVDIWASLEGDTRHLSAWDQDLIRHVQGSVRQTLTGVTRALAIHSTGASKQSVFKLTYDLIMASRHLDGLSHERAKESLAMARASVCVAALEKLLPALKAIDSGHTQQAVAQICDWGAGVRSRKPRAA